VRWEWGRASRAPAGPVLSQLGRAAPAYRSLPAATRCSVQLCTASCTPDPTEVWQCGDTAAPQT